MNFGRVFCVAFPFLATLAALITLLIATLGGKYVNSVYMFEVNLKDLGIDPEGIQGIVNDLNDLTSRQVPDIPDVPDLPDVPDVPDLPDLLPNNNITADDLNLDEVYLVNLWGYCSGRSVDKAKCTEPKLDWASTALNTTFLRNVGSASGADIELPQEIEDGLELFATGIKYLQIVFIVALALLGLELFFGFFTGCSRAWSCVTYIVAGIATTATIGAAIFATVMITTVVGVVAASAEVYGVKAGFNTTFLGLIWASVALAIAAGLFWCFSICCCAPKHDRKSKRYLDEKDYPTGSYQPLGDNRSSSYNMGYSPQHQTPYAPGAAYEPYSHRV